MNYRYEVVLSIWNEDNPSKLELCDKSTLLDEDDHDDNQKLIMPLLKCNTDWEC